MHNKEILNFQAGQVEQVDCSGGNIDDRFRRR